MNHFSMEQSVKEKISARIKEGLHEQEVNRHFHPKIPAARNWTRLAIGAAVLILIVRFAF